MKNTIKDAALIFMIVIGSILAYDFHTVLIDAGKTLRDADRAITQIDSTAYNLSAMTAKMNFATDAELKEFQKTQASLRLAITFTDKNLNDPASGLLPQFQKVLQHTDVDMSAVAQSFESVSADLHPALASFAVAGQNAANDFGDPSIKASLQNVNRTTFEVAGIATDGHAETTLLVSKTRDAFKPQNKFLSILKMIVGNTVTGAELFYYLSH